MCLRNTVLLEDLKRYYAIIGRKGIINKKIFEEHLVNVLQEKGIDAKSCNYVIYPILEDGKKYNSKDDFVRLNVFPLNKISNYIFTLEEVVKRFSVFEPYYPLWIDVYVNGNDIIELHTSLRFRKPSELLRRATGNVPFKFVEQ